jgi:glycerol-3-phosphate dehydrogenase
VIGFLSGRTARGCGSTAVRAKTPATSLIRENGQLAGVIAEHQGAPVAIRAGAVVLACGSFESNPEMRARHIGCDVFIETDR